MSNLTRPVIDQVVSGRLDRPQRADPHHGKGTVLGVSYSLRDCDWVPEQPRAANWTRGIESESSETFECAGDVSIAIDCCTGRIGGGAE